jgi:starvation-inducible DNA-binding protein
MVMATAEIKHQGKSAPAVDIGIDAEQRRSVADGLSHMLADSYALLVKTHNFHWNVTGPMFRALHSMFEEQYKELQGAVDEIAERIRALGHMAPGSFSRFLELATIDEEMGTPAAEEMIRQLASGHEAVDRTARAVLASADAAGDQVTVDLVTERMQVHEKQAWMLRSILA